MKKIKEAAGQKTLLFCRLQRGSMEKKKLIQRCNEHIRWRFHDNRGEKHKNKKNMEEPLILKSELSSAIANMKKNKAAGPGKIVIEMLTVLNNLGINKFSEVIDKIYESIKMAVDLSKSLLIALQKKTGTNNCKILDELHT